ncbi:hypothetical protein CDAR_220181 [Caerostris darwini]|uniref:Uncharacterized protein n=1 Tax=Caerostris darwini TaxID=1538125 RepID=A0AAV4VHV8_9ARAC|nr:hypothetical protein CDAR_220181 [Caerostris darwini]
MRKSVYHVSLQVGGLWSTCTLGYCTHGSRMHDTDFTQFVDTTRPMSARGREAIGRGPRGGAWACEWMDLHGCGRFPQFGHILVKGFKRRERVFGASATFLVPAEICQLGREELMLFDRNAEVIKG